LSRPTFANILNSKTIFNYFFSCLCCRVPPPGHDRVLHEQGQGLDLHLIGQGPRVQGTLGRARSQDHHDRNPDCSSVVHLRCSQGDLLTSLFICLPFVCLRPFLFICQLLSNSITLFLSLPLSPSLSFSVPLSISLSLSLSFSVPLSSSLSLSLYFSLLISPSISLSFPLSLSVSPYVSLSILTLSLNYSLILCLCLFLFMYLSRYTLPLSQYIFFLISYF
jgi:hypothetical protein